MALPRLAASRPKSEFFERLGLSEDNELHRELYKRMKDEAAAGRQRTSQDPQNLVRKYRNDPYVQPPFSSNQITETAMHKEILTIYRTASPLTKPYYDLGHYIQGDNEENWVIRWLLWHVFRYRDSRNRRFNNAKSPASTTVEVQSNAGGDFYGSPTPYAEVSHDSRSAYWDPVRNA